MKNLGKIILGLAAVAGIFAVSKLVGSNKNQEPEKKPAPFDPTKFGYDPTRTPAPVKPKPKVNMPEFKKDDIVYAKEDLLLYTAPSVEQKYLVSTVFKKGANIGWYNGVSGSMAAIERNVGTAATFDTMYSGSILKKFYVPIVKITNVNPGMKA